MVACPRFSLRMAQLAMWSVEISDNVEDNADSVAVCFPWPFAVRPVQETPNAHCISKSVPWVRFEPGRGSYNPEPTVGGALYQIPE